MPFKKQNLLLYIALAAPILMICIVAISIYLPNAFNKPGYGFIFTEGFNNFSYKIDAAGKVQKAPNPAAEPAYPPSYLSNPSPVKPAPAFPAAKIYYYDVKNESAKEITFEQAQAYKLSAEASSPDGYKMEYGSTGGNDFPFFFFANTDYSTHYLIGHGIHKKINLPQATDGYYYPSQFIFIGWVLNK